MTCRLCGGSGRIGVNHHPGTPLFNIRPCPVCLYHQAALHRLQETQ